MRSMSRILAVAGFTLLAACSDATGAQQRTLYQRLGGYDAIAAVPTTSSAGCLAIPRLPGSSPD